jgi:hypothetical protein
MPLWPDHETLMVRLHVDSLMALFHGPASGAGPQHGPAPVGVMESVNGSFDGLPHGHADLARPWGAHGPDPVGVMHSLMVRPL